VRAPIPRSLRGRLLLATVALVAVGLVVAGVATYAFLHDFLIGRVDQQLAAAVNQVGHDLGEANHPPFGGGPHGSPAIPAGTFGVLLDPSGKTIQVVTYVYDQGQDVPLPDFPPGLPGSTQAPTAEPQYLNLTSADDSVPYRTLAVRTVDPVGTLVVGVPLSEVIGTLHRLVVVEVLGAAAVLILVGALAWWLVRLGLRPLQTMGETAGAIAAGDLSRRVTPAEDDTEVGRLGLSLNAMLGQIEDAFREREATEGRLRRFVADASHELRTPLTSIRGYAELFRRGASDRPQDLAKAMERIEAEASRMGVLVEDLLLLARMDQGLPIARDRVDLTALAGRAVEDARAAWPDHSIRLDAPGPVEVVGDEGRLRQVLDNLLGNVGLHTPPGTATSVRIAPDAAATLEISDDGPGIDAEVADRVFERFYRADPSRSRERGGAGLGLAIAAEIARAHGGSLTLVPTERGATFRLGLTLAPQEPEPASPPATTAPVPGRTA
jgi:two-component system, OmpR family, sensor kinase